MHYMLTMRDIQIAVFDIVDHMRHVRGEVPLNTDQPATSEISSALVKSEKVVLGVRFGRYGAADASRPGVETLGLESSFREKVFPSRTLKGSPCCWVGLIVKPAVAVPRGIYFRRTVCGGRTSR